MGTPVRELPEPAPRRRTGGTVLIRRVKTIGGVMLIA